MPTLPDKADESDTDRDGFLSYAAEWHAVGIGAAFGLSVALTGRYELAGFFALVIAGKARVTNAHLRDAAKEAAYSGGAFVALFLIGTLVA